MEVPTHNWAPDAQVKQAYKHHDIIGHRVVDLNTPFNEKLGENDRKKEIREKQRISALKTNREFREKKERVEKEVKRKELEQRDEINK